MLQMMRTVASPDQARLLFLYLTSIVPGLSSGTETAGWQDEDLLSDRVDLPHALVVVDDGNPGLTDPQWNGSGWK